MFCQKAREYVSQEISSTIYGCFQKSGYPQIIHFNRVFHYKPSILGYAYFWKHPYSYPVILRILWFFSSSFSRKIHHPWLLSSPNIAGIPLNCGAAQLCDCTLPLRSVSNELTQYRRVDSITTWSFFELNLSVKSFIWSYFRLETPKGTTFLWYPKQPFVCFFKLHSLKLTWQWKIPTLWRCIPY